MVKFAPKSGSETRICWDVPSPCAAVPGMAWGPVLSSLLGSRRIVQGWNAWTSLLLHPGHALLPTPRPGCWDLVADGVFRESPFLAWSGRWDAGALPALLAWHCSQYGKLSGLICGCLVEGRAPPSTAGCLLGSLWHCQAEMFLEKHLA